MAASKKKSPVDPLTALAQVLRQLPVFERPLRLCVALSGGRDSLSLLTALVALQRQGALPSCTLTAVHVHHGLSPHADDWLAFCVARCADLAVPLETARVMVARDADSLEAAARAARYAVFERLPADYLLLAHHRDDQAETVLFNLLRGAGVRGAAGMRQQRPLPAGPVLLRPWLALPGDEIARWAKAQGLVWIDDESNADPRYSRNFLRLQALPLLAQRFPVAQSLTRAASHFAEAETLLDELALLDWQGETRLQTVVLAGLTPPRGRNLLRYALRRGGAQLPDSVALEELRRQLLAVRSDSHIVLAAGTHDCHAWQGELWVERCLPPPPLPQAWALDKPLPWAGGLLQAEAVSGEGLAQAALAAGMLSVRARSGGERLRLGAQRPQRTLKQLWQEAGMPPWRRSSAPLLWVGEELAWVAGVGVAAAFACAPGEPGWRLSWQPGE